MVQTPQHNLDCTDIKALLSALVDDEVDQPTRHGAERHLAGCTSCRAMLDEAESLDRLLRNDYTARADEGLPMGFEQSVLSVLRDDQRISAYWRHWTTWAGWFAAAACLALAVTMWIGQDRRARSLGDVAINTNDTDDIDNARLPRNAALAQGLRRSWTLDENLPDELDIYGPPAPAELTSRPASLSRTMTTDPFFVDPGLSAVRARRSYSGHPTGDGAEEVDSQVSDSRGSTIMLSDADRSALYLASIVLDLVAHADDASSSDLNDAREIIEYDGLVLRLSEARARVNAADQLRVDAAVAVLEQLAKQVTAGDELESVQQSIAAEGLIEALDRLSRRPRSTPAI